MEKYAIIVAGGSGTRMKTEVPKQFLLLKGKPVLFHTIEKFNKLSASVKIILALPSNQISHWKNLCKKYKFNIEHKIVSGGKERFFSVKNGLKQVTEKSIVAVHDGVRPLVKTETIQKCFASAEKKGNAIPVISVNESLRKKKGNKNFSVNRKEFFIVQTPQCFRSEILKTAYKQNFSPQFTDDASVVEKSGKKIYFIDGNPENIKITTPVDLKMAEILMKNSD